MVFLILLVKNLLEVQDHNIIDKICSASRNTRNRYFQKTRALCAFRRPYEPVYAPLRTCRAVVSFLKQPSHTPLTLAQRTLPLNPLFNLVFPHTPSP